MLIRSLLILISCVILANASNWAQLSGPQLQNIVTVDDTPWTPRWASAAGYVYFDPALSVNSAYDDDSMRTKIYLTGGDDFNPATGGGGFRNDVWYTPGANYNLVNSLLKNNFRGDPLPETISNIKWVQLSNDLLPPPGISYNTWISCAVGNAGFNWAYNCSALYATEFSSVRFSQRKFHQSVGFNGKIYVLGGRASSGEDIPMGWEDSHGGILNKTRLDMREQSILKNDVWSSTNGVEWKLVNPGCSVPDKDLSVFGGDSNAVCSDNTQCYGDSTCVAGTCVCNIWQGRERFQVTVFNSSMWVFGGMTEIEINKCGEYSCGGGYRGFMNDIWRSFDGAVWKEFKPVITGPKTPMWRGRGEHAVVVMNLGLTNSVDQLYLFGGRTGLIEDGSNNPYLNDLWTSVDGINWQIVKKNCEWSPRGSFMGGAMGNQLIVAFGENSTSQIDEVWVSTGLGPWIKDFSWGQTQQQFYIDALRPLKYMQVITQPHIDILNSFGIHTVTDFAFMNWDYFSNIWSNTNYSKDELCRDYKFTNRSYWECQVIPRSYDGEEFANVTIIRGGRGAIVVQPFLYNQFTVHPCDFLPIEKRAAAAKDLIDNPQNYYLPPFNMTCAIVPSKRAFSAYVLFDGRFYMFGGRDINGLGNNDVWFRDPVIPQSSFSVKPRFQSHDTLFGYTSTEPWCRYEYQYTDLSGNVLRNWTSALNQTDYVSWLSGGEYIWYVRAIDPAGNIDLSFNRYQNLYDWVYIPEPPWVLIFSMIGLFLFLCLCVYLEIRRRRRKAALERYAMKRMRRKFKKEAREAGGKGDDWKEYQEEAIKKELSALEAANAKGAGAKKLRAQMDAKNDGTDTKKEKASSKKVAGTKKKVEKSAREEKKEERREKRKKERKSEKKRPE